jgi:glycosyltransferase involved in cell wall biosynthesis
LKILHVITTIERGGAELQVLGLARTQVTHGHSVTLLPLKGQADLKTEFESVGARVEIGMLRVPSFLQMFMVTILAPRFDVVHCHLPQAELIALLCPRRKTIATRHFGGQFHPSASKRFSTFLAHLSERRKSAIVAISQSQFSFLEKNEIRKKRKLHLIPYGFDHERFDDSEASQDVHLDFLKSKRDQGFRVIGVISRLSVEKQVELIVNCFVSAYSADERQILVILGAGNLETSIQMQIIKSSASDRIFLMGKKPNIASFLDVFDVFVHASKFEGFGMVYLEAMYFRKPIVTTPNAAALEIFGSEGPVIFSSFTSGEEFRLQIDDATTKSIDHIQKYPNIMKKYSLEQSYTGYIALYNKLSHSLLQQ